MATGSTWNARQLDQRLARLRLHVGGVDDRQAAGGQTLGGDEVQRLEGVAGRRLVVLVVARPGPEVSEDSTSVGLKCVRAKVDLPEPDAPIRTTSDRVREWSAHVTPKHRHLRRRPERSILGSDRPEAHAVAEARSDGSRPCRELGARPLEAVVAMTEPPGGQARPERRCIRRSAW